MSCHLIVSAITFTAISAFAALASSTAAPHDKLAPPNAPPEVPKDIALPDGHSLLFQLSAEGVQIYVATANASSGALEWKFEGPLAELSEPGAPTSHAGYHYDGPSWESTDGSKVMKVEAKSAASPHPKTDIPWLLVKVKAESGPEGRFSDVMYIHRVNTAGGVAPTDPPHRAGTRVGVPYTATYCFYGKAK